jgi:hypothetical protein
VHLVSYFHSCITMHGFMNVKFIKYMFSCPIQLLSKTLLRPGRTQQNIFITVGRSSCKYSKFLPNFDQIWIVPTEFTTSFQYKIYETSYSRSQCFLCGQADKQIDVTKLIFCFRNFAKVSKSLHKNIIFCFLDCIVDLEKKAVKL